jgi:hypothetical protein
MVLHSFNNDDGVVDHKSNRQHQAEERKRVDRETQCGEDDERSNQRDRNGQQRNQRGPPSLEKDEDDDDNQGERFKKRKDNLADTGGDCLGRIKRDAVLMLGGKVAESSFIRALTAAAVCTAFEPGS